MLAGVVATDASRHQHGIDLECSAIAPKWSHGRIVWFTCPSRNSSEHVEPCPVYIGWMA